MKLLTATVVKHTGSHYLLTVLPEWNLFPAVMRGKVRLLKSKATNPVAAGDRVVCQVPDEYCTEGSACLSDDRPAVITQVLPRDNYIIRKSTNLSRQSHVIAANVDRAFVVVTLACPEVKLPFLDRLLVTCEVYGVPVIIVLNKVDLLYNSCGGEGFSDNPSRTSPGPSPCGQGGSTVAATSAGTEEKCNGSATDDICNDAGAPDIERACTEDPGAEYIKAFREIYEAAGYRVIETSARTGQGIDELREAMSRGCEGGAGMGVNLLSGVSGVGKSSLIKALDPSLNPRTGEISEAHLQGRHTTTFYEMYPLSGGGFIIDTPGIRSFGLTDLEPEEIGKYFPEMLYVSQDCRFTPCTHTHEPGCAVKAALEKGEISAERYSSYLGMLEEYSKYRI